MKQPFTAILLGPPGSGKSTQADFLVAEMDAVHIDIGLALRKTSEMETSLGKKISSIMNERMGLVPDDIVEEVLSGALASISPSKNVIIDGAPRRLSQVKLVEDVLATFERAVDFVLFVSLSEEESVRRISRRWLCPKCNRPFIAGVDFRAGEELCPSCGTTLSRRKDDTEEGVQKRFHVFLADTLPVVQFYQEKGVLLEVDGAKEPSSIFEEIRRDIQTK